MSSQVNYYYYYKFLLHARVTIKTNSKSKEVVPNAFNAHKVVLKTLEKQKVVLKTFDIQNLVRSTITVKQEGQKYLVIHRSYSQVDPVFIVFVMFLVVMVTLQLTIG